MTNSSEGEPQGDPIVMQEVQRERAELFNALGAKVLHAVSELDQHLLENPEIDFQANATPGETAHFGLGKQVALREVMLDLAARAGRPIDLQDLDQLTLPYDLDL